MRAALSLPHIKRGIVLLPYKRGIVLLPYKRALYKRGAPFYMRQGVDGHLPALSLWQKNSFGGTMAAIKPFFIL